MEAKGSFSVVLISIIAVLALAIAGLTAYVFIFTGTKSQEGVPHEMTRPADTDIVVKKLYEDSNIFNLKSTEDKKISVIKINIELVYYKKVDGIKSVETKLATYDGAIKELIITYFQSMTIDEARLPLTKDKAKQDLTKKINELLSSSEKEQKSIIYTVNFDEWFYQ